VLIPVSGRGVHAVRVRLEEIPGSAPRILSLAEVQVWGKPRGETGGEASRCAEGKERDQTTLACPGSTIARVDFASYGLPAGTCDEGYQLSSCHAASSSSVVSQACVGKESCTIDVRSPTFGADPCTGKPKQLSVRYTCSATTQCSEVAEGSNLRLSCPDGKTIRAITFASYGLPEGTCGGGFRESACHAGSSKEAVADACVGKQSCTILARSTTFAVDPCPGRPKKLGVEYTCDAAGAGADIGPGKVRVFVLAGQSNMVGKGIVDDDHPVYYNGGRGNLEHVMQSSPLRSMYSHLKDADGEWTVRDDVGVRYVRPNGEIMAGGLTVGYTESGFDALRIGPELQIGHVLGDHYDEPVVLIKVVGRGRAVPAGWQLLSSPELRRADGQSLPADARRGRRSLEPA